jgi:peptidoglycan/LPS O-acetylase OafA/YrhL
MSEANQESQLPYRPDIDGLRAVAVLPVVFYHFRIAPFSGGFVGVDIFFVISGYLITSLIRREMENGEFSLLGFYERRIRRIFPALFVMLIVTSIVAFAILFPYDLQKYSRSLAATAAFGSNVYFWSTVDYFDLAAERKPLLHTWSLAAEEQ